jgi:nitrogen fixation/metabolism regulation signal transduction histidine kinase
MRAAEAVGHRIVKVNQQRFYNRNLGMTDVAITSIVLDNGKLIVLSALDGDSEPYVSASMVTVLRSPHRRRPGEK